MDRKTKQLDEAIVRFLRICVPLFFDILLPIFPQIMLFLMFIKVYIKIISLSIADRFSPNLKYFFQIIACSQLKMSIFGL